MVNTMKEMNKEDLQGIFSSISEDEVDESLTKENRKKHCRTS